MKKFLIMLISVLLSACSVSDEELRDQYMDYYHQNDGYVEQYQKQTQNLSVQQLALQGAKKEKAKLHGQTHFYLGNGLYIENVQADNNQVIFEYSFDKSSWSNLSKSAQDNMHASMNKDLIYRTCSLRTVKLAQEKGLEEHHRYYYDYPNKSLAFELTTSKQICLDNGFQR
ncbi:MAG: hypothetical protein Q4A81_09120 [Pasteurellaceae bacterium]|nr:hypothetical protein [Pasteurellaceae bacterium]